MRVDVTLPVHEDDIVGQLVPPVAQAGRMHDLHDVERNKSREGTGRLYLLDERVVPAERNGGIEAFLLRECKRLDRAAFRGGEILNLLDRPVHFFQRLCADGDEDIGEEHFHIVRADRVLKAAGRLNRFFQIARRPGIDDILLYLAGKAVLHLAVKRFQPPVDLPDRLGRVLRRRVYGDQQPVVDGGDVAQHGVRKVVRDLGEEQRLRVTVPEPDIIVVARVDKIRRDQVLVDHAGAHHALVAELRGVARPIDLPEQGEPLELVQHGRPASEPVEQRHLLGVDPEKTLLSQFIALFRDRDGDVFLLGVCAVADVSPAHIIVVFPDAKSLFLGRVRFRADAEADAVAGERLRQNVDLKTHRLVERIQELAKQLRRRFLLGIFRVAEIDVVKRPRRAVLAVSKRADPVVVHGFKRNAFLGGVSFFPGKEERRNGFSSPPGVALVLHLRFHTPFDSVG